MSTIDRKGFKASIEGKNKRIAFSASFMDSTLQLDASLRLAEFCIKYLPMISMFTPGAKAELDEAKRHIEAAIREAK